MLQVTPPPQTFLQQVEPMIIGFLGLVLTPLAIWIVALLHNAIAQLKVNHATTVAAAADTSEKLASIKTATDGANNALTGRADVATAALLADKDKQIANLTLKNGGKETC